MSKFPDPNVRVNLGALAAKNYMNRHGDNYLQRCREILSKYQLDITDAILSGQQIPNLDNAIWYRDSDPFLRGEIGGNFFNWLAENNLVCHWGDLNMTYLVTDFNRGITVDQYNQILSQQAVEPINV